MAETKDVEINQFPIVSSLSNKDYVVVSLDNGSQGRIKTSDLASVVAAAMGSPLGFKGLLKSSDDANNLKDGIYNVLNADSPSNMLAYNSILFQFTHKYRTDCYQILFEANERNIKARMKTVDSWTSWKVLFTF